MKQVLRPIVTILLTAAVIFAPISSALAVSGDRQVGCRQGNGCEMQMWTNQCTSATTFWWGILVRADPRPHQYYNLGPHCALRWRFRMINAAGNDYYTTAYTTIINNRSTRTGNVTAGWFELKKACWAEWSVRRNDGTWYTEYHYTDKFKSSQTTFEICTES